MTEEKKEFKMESVNLQSNCYNNMYSNKQETTNNNVAFKGEHKDSFDKKYKTNRNKEAMNTIGTIALMAVSAFAAFKNKDKISNIINQLKGKTNSGVNTLKTKFPNISDAMSSIRKACDTPINGIKNVGSKAVKAASYTADKVKGIFSKKV